MRKQDLIILLILSTSLSPIISEPRLVHTVNPNTITANPPNVTLQAGTSTTTQITVANNGASSSTTQLVVTIYPYRQINVTLNPDTVTLPAGGNTTTTATITTNSTTTPAQYSVEVGSYLGQVIFNVTVTPGTPTVPDFSIRASATTTPAPAGTIVHFALNVTSLAGFTGDVNLSPNPFGTPSPYLIHLTSGNTVILTFDTPDLCPSIVDQFQFTATSGPRLHWLVVSIVPSLPGPIFCFRADTEMKMTIGSSLTTNLIFYTYNGFGGNATLTASSNMTTDFFPTNNVIIGSSNQPGPYSELGTGMIITIPPSTLPGNYTVNVTATSGAQSYSTKIPVQAISGPYFTIATNATQLTIHKGSTAYLRVSVTSQNYTGQVLLNPFASSRSFSYTADPAEIFVQEGWTTFSTVGINATGVPPGHYQLVMGATSAYIPYVLAVRIIPVIVDNAATPGPTGGSGPTSSTGTSGSNILGLPSTIFYSGIVAAAAIVIVTTTLFLRSKKRKF